MSGTPNKIEPLVIEKATLNLSGQTLVTILQCLKAHPVMSALQEIESQVLPQLKPQEPPK